MEKQDEKFTFTYIYIKVYNILRDKLHPMPMKVKGYIEAKGL